MERAKMEEAERRTMELQELEYRRKLEAEEHRKMREESERRAQKQAIKTDPEDSECKVLEAETARIDATAVERERADETCGTDVEHNGSPKKG
jgi:hypothetical protein